MTSSVCKNFSLRLRPENPITISSNGFYKKVLQKKKKKGYLKKFFGFCFFCALIIFCWSFLLCKLFELNRFPCNYRPTNHYFCNFLKVFMVLLRTSKYRFLCSQTASTRTYLFANAIKIILSTLYFLQLGFISATTVVIFSFIILRCIKIINI